MSAPGRSPRENHPYQNYSWVQLHEVIVEKEYQVECLRDELHKLGNVDSESRRKDEVISVLRREVAEYKKSIQVHDSRNSEIDEQLTQYESILQQKTHELDTLQAGLDEKLKSESSKLVTTCKELQRLSEVKTQLESEVKELRANRDQSKDTISALRKQLAEKKNRTGSLQDQTKKLQANNHDLQATLATLEAEHSRLLESEKQLKSEIKRLKSINSEGLMIHQKCEFVEKELAKAKRNENEMATSIGKLESELRQLCDHIASCTQSHGSSISSSSPKRAADLVSKMASDHDEASDMLASLEQEQAEDKEALSKIQTNVAQLVQFWKSIHEKLTSDSSATLDNLSSGLVELQSSEGCMKGLHEAMTDSLKALSHLEERCRKDSSSLTDHVKNCYSILENPPDAKTAAEMATNMIEAIKTSEKEVKRLNDKITAAELEHNASLSGAITAMRQDEKQRIAEVEDKIRQDEEAKRTAELQKQMQDLDFQKQEAVLKERECVELLEKQLESVKNDLEQERIEKDSLITEIEGLKSRISEKDASSFKAISEMKNQQKSTETILTREVNSHKEQAQQHAITIMELEKKLVPMVEKLKALQAENSAMQKELEETKKIVEVITKEGAEKGTKSDQLIRVLKNQLAMMVEESSSKDSALKKSSKKIVSMQKDMENRVEELKSSHCKAITDLQITMAKQEAVIQSKSDEIDVLTTHLSDRMALLDTTMAEFKKTKEELHKMQRHIAEGNDVTVKPSKLAEAGHHCLREKHGDIIDNQKTALLQLRQKVSDLELAKPPIGSHQATLKELSRVRHELAKLKATGTTSSKTAPSSQKKQEEDAKLIPQFISDSIEESKVREALVRKLEDTLLYSEKTYGALVEAVHQGLPNFEGVVCTEVLSASDEPTKKKDVIKARKKFADAVLKHLGSQKKQNKTKVGREDTGRSPDEIIADLEATLNETAEELEQQKRLNQALLRRKTFHESQQMTFKQRPRHSCKSTLD